MPPSKLQLEQNQGNYLCFVVVVVFGINKFFCNRCKTTITTITKLNCGKVVLCFFRQLVFAFIKLSHASCSSKLCRLAVAHNRSSSNNNVENRSFVIYMIVVRAAVVFPCSWSK